MKRIALFLVPLILLFAAVPLSAKTPLGFKFIVVQHFTNANGANQSPEFINLFCDDLRNWLQKNESAGQVVEDEDRTTIPPADAANSLVLEGKFDWVEKGGLLTPGELEAEVSIYRLSDHALVRTLPAKAAFNGSPESKGAANISSMQIGMTIRKAIENVSLASIPPAPPAAPSPAPAAVAPTVSVVQAFVTIDSTPPDADIEIDGTFVGNTPSTVAVAPGNHQIAVKKKGYTDWSKTLSVTGGSIRLNAELDQEPPKS